MDKEAKRQVSKVVSAFTLSLKLGRIHEITMRLRHLGFDGVSIEGIIGSGIKDAVRNFNDTIGQKV